MKRYLCFLVLPLMLLFASSCFNGSEPVMAKPAKVPGAPLTQLMKDRAAFLKERVFSKCAASGVFITQQGMTLYEGRTDELAKRILLLGFTDAFLIFDPLAGAASASLGEFSLSLSKQGIKVWLYIDSPRLYAGDVQLDPMIVSTVSFCSAHPEIGGVFIYQRPDQICGPARNYNSNILYAWDDECYGKGLDNDQLIKCALDIVSKFRKALPEKVELMQMVSPTYDKCVKEGMLSKGSASDFLKMCSMLCVSAYFSDRIEIMENIEQPLKNVKKDSSLFVAVRTHVDRYGGADKEKSLSGKSWFKLVKDLESVIGSAASFKSFRGIAFYDYYGLEKMWEALEEKPASGQTKGK